MFFGFPRIFCFLVLERQKQKTCGIFGFLSSPCQVKEEKPKNYLGFFGFSRTKIKKKQKT